MDALLEHMDAIYKAALTAARDEHIAEELVQETYLHAIQAVSRGTSIHSPRAYLLSVLHNRFYMRLREKYKLSTVSFEDMPRQPSVEADFERLERGEAAMAVRRQLAFLSQTYRETMVRYYMKNESVMQIANALGIPKGTVLSRLDAGRKKVKDGIDSMNTYDENSYYPETLTLGINGRMGQNNEPFSCVKSLLDQNILITAYEKPLTVSEISRALGTPMAFVEERVKSLVYEQFMKRDGKRVATDFFIKSDDDSLKALEVGKAFAKQTFDRVNDVIMKMIDRYKTIEGFSTFNGTQLYLCAVLSMRLGIGWRIYEAATGTKTLDFEDYPDRPNYGKWILTGNRSPHGYSDTGEKGKYEISGRAGVDNINDYVYSACEWNSAIGPTHWATMKYSLTMKKRVQLIDAVRSDTIDAFQTELLPDMERYGFIKTEGGKKVPAIPYITREEEKNFFDIEREAGEDFCAACLDDAVRVCNENKISYPKRLLFAEEFSFGLPISLIPMAYAYEAARRGMISIEEGKHYPVMYMVKR